MSSLIKESETLENYSGESKEEQNGYSENVDLKVQDVYSHNDEDLVTDKCEDQDADNDIHGDHETQLSEGGEPDLHKHMINCKKNPGHKEFIPVDTFSLNDLPDGHRDSDLHEVIKAAADLTVRVDVRMTSPGRPGIWPGSNVPYPFYNLRESTKLRTGSGMISTIRKFTDGVNEYDQYEPLEVRTKCYCRKCQVSDSPSNVWWEFCVHTATHVVFDDTEASHTSVKLFYDNDESPVVSVDKIEAGHVNIDLDIAELICVTCDGDLGNKLKKIWDHYKDVWWKIGDKYRKSRDMVKLTFIVSHPHGRAKKISVGHWVDIYQTGRLKKFTYTTSTCPGSSGAYVHCLGYDNNGLWCAELVHSGSLEPGLNLSGLGRAF